MRGQHGDRGAEGGTADSPADEPGDGRRHGGFTLWAARHPILTALLMSVALTLLGIAKNALVALTSDRPLHFSSRRLGITAGAMELIFFAMFAALTLTVARSRRRAGVPLTAEGLGLPFEEDRDAAARRPPALLILRPSLRHPSGLIMMLPLLLGVLSAVAGTMNAETGHGGVVLWFGMAVVLLASGVWTTTGHRRQRVVVDCDDVYVYTFTGRYYRAERARVAELRRTQGEPILAGADGGRLVRLPYLMGAQRAELARVLQVPVRERVASGAARKP